MQNENGNNNDNSNGYDHQINYKRFIFQQSNILRPCNWLDWKWKCQKAFEQLELWWVIENSPCSSQVPDLIFVDLNQRVCTIIRSLIDPSFEPIIANCTTAHQMWKTLINFFEGPALHGINGFLSTKNNYEKLDQKSLNNQTESVEKVEFYQDQQQEIQEIKNQKEIFSELEPSLMMLRQNAENKVINAKKFIDTIAPTEMMLGGEDFDFLPSVEDESQLLKISDLQSKKLKYVQDMPDDLMKTLDYYDSIQQDCLFETDDLSLWAFLREFEPKLLTDVERFYYLSQTKIVLFQTNDGSFFALDIVEQNEIINSKTNRLPVPKEIVCIWKEKIVSILSGVHHVIILKESGQLFLYQNSVELYNASQFEPILYLKNITKISTGLHHFMALDVDGFAWFWTCSHIHRLVGNSDEEKKFEKHDLQLFNKSQTFVCVACTHYYSAALTFDNQIWISWDYFPKIDQFKIFSFKTTSIKFLCGGVEQFLFLTYHGDLYRLYSENEEQHTILHELIEVEQPIMYCMSASSYCYQQNYRDMVEMFILVTVDRFCHIIEISNNKQSPSNIFKKVTRTCLSSVPDTMCLYAIANLETSISQKPSVLVSLARLSENQKNLFKDCSFNNHHNFYCCIEIVSLYDRNLKPKKNPCIYLTKELYEKVSSFFPFKAQSDQFEMELEKNPGCFNSRNSSSIVIKCHNFSYSVLYAYLRYLNDGFTHIDYQIISSAQNEVDLYQSTQIWLSTPKN